MVRQALKKIKKFENKKFKKKILKNIEKIEKL
jgi:hypothetical protein